MKVVETRTGAAILTFKGKLTERLKSKIRKNTNPMGINYLFYFVGIIFSVYFFTLHWILGLIILGIVTYLLSFTARKINRETYFKFILNHGVIYFISMDKDLDYREAHNTDIFEQLYIQKKQENTYILNLIFEKNGVRQQLDLLEFDEKHLREMMDVKDYVHDFYNTIPEEVEEIELPDKNANFVPKKKRSFFKVFDQDLDDIRTKGVFTLKGEDYFVDKTYQTEWDNGMISYCFSLVGDTSLYYHPLVNRKFLFLESPANTSLIEDFIDEEEVMLEKARLLKYNGGQYYFVSRHQGVTSLDGNYLSDDVYQMLFESENGQKILRFYDDKGKVTVTLGTIIQESQINQILPQIENN
ncbi:hypothetical protein MY04_2776 [Flammeovirga sp. MY04]|uniref:hypothetical protein n=1 Tax=Flammeovirga sp. MY04 TaxID=1191459 RepID=UPI0008061FF7|nr:hypothetical protein [Flammeovirga sp. MY04]ANQ50144.1 hypothetical protein MY04_2776 [Flammeovirga sp. MY04]